MRGVMYCCVMRRISVDASRVVWVDAAKGLAVVGVVLLHASHWLGVIGGSSPVAEWIVARLVVPLPVLFFVSGVVARAAVHAPQSLRRRLTTLFWLFVLWQPVVLGYRLLGGATLGDGVDLGGEVLRTLVSPLRPNGELWYLWALAVHLVLARLTRRVPTAVVLAVAAVLFVGWGGFGATLLGADRWHALGPGLQGLPQFALFTLVGTRLTPAALARIDHTRLPVALVAVAVWLLLGGLGDRIPGGALPVLGVLQVTAGTVATVLVARQCARLRFAGPLLALGRRSLAPYLGHTAVIVAVLAVVRALDRTAVLVAHPGPALTLLVAVGLFLPLGVERLTSGTRARVAFAAPRRLLVRAG